MKISTMKQLSHTSQLLNYQVKSEWILDYGVPFGPWISVATNEFAWTRLSFKLIEYKVIFQPLGWVMVIYFIYHMVKIVR